MILPRCPRCQVSLSRASQKKIRYYECKKCQGEAISALSLRAIIKNDWIREIRLLSEKTKPDLNTPCPHCLKGMRPVQFKPKNILLKLDICRSCNVVWFDGGESTELDIIKIEKTQIIQSHSQSEVSDEAFYTEKSFFISTTHPGGIKTLLTIFGFPVEAEPNRLKAFPLLTWGLILFSVISSLFAFKNLDLFHFLAFKPTDPFLKQIISSFTVFFVHGSFFHLLGNMYFLWVFGDNVEDELGHLSYLMLVAFATSVGTLSYMFISPNSEIPLVGASGGISGLMSFYLLRFPKRTFTLMFFFRWFRINVWIFALLYIGKDILGVFLQAHGATNVSHISHLGGALIGVIFYFIHGVSSHHRKWDF